MNFECICFNIFFLFPEKLIKDSQTIRKTRNSTMKYVQKITRYLKKNGNMNED